MKIVKSLFFIVIIACTTLIVSCEKNPFKSDEFNRVVLLYMAANNNLSSYAEYNIGALKEGYIPEKNSKDILIVYQHMAGSNPRLVRYFKEDGVVKEDLVTAYDDQNSAKGDVLKAVLNKVNIVFPAKEYGLILWSHATGWLPEGYYGSSLNEAYFKDPYEGLVKSFGEDRGVEMEIKELKGALPFKFSFIIFDCCLMGGIETIYELRNKADYIVASPTEILAYGFPYREVISSLFKARPNLHEACQSFFDYYNNQSGVHQSATVSLYRTADIKELSDVCKTIFNNRRENISQLDLSIIQPYFRMNKSWFWDLGDLIAQISEPDEYEMFKTALDKVVIAKWNTPSFLDININSFSGISTYIQKPPNSFLDTFYKGFDWNIETGMVN